MFNKEEIKYNLYKYSENQMNKWSKHKLQL